MSEVLDLLNSLGIAGPNIPHVEEVGPDPKWSPEEMDVYRATRHERWCVCGRLWPCEAKRLADLLAASQPSPSAVPEHKIAGDVIRAQDGAWVPCSCGARMPFPYDADDRNGEPVTALVIHLQSLLAALPPSAPEACPSCGAVNPPDFSRCTPSAPEDIEGLRRAAKAVLDNAETDDNFEGEFIDWLVPHEYLEALREALASSPVPPTEGR